GVGGVGRRLLDRQPLGPQDEALDLVALLFRLLVLLVRLVRLLAAVDGGVARRSRSRMTPGRPRQGGEDEGRQESAAANPFASHHAFNPPGKATVWAAGRAGASGTPPAAGATPRTPRPLLCRRPAPAASARPRRRAACGRGSPTSRRRRARRR